MSNHHRFLIYSPNQIPTIPPPEMRPQILIYQIPFNTPINQIYRQADKTLPNTYFLFSNQYLPFSLENLPYNELLHFEKNKHPPAIIELTPFLKFYHRSIIHLIYPIPEKYEDCFQQYILPSLEKPFEDYILKIHPNNEMDNCSNKPIISRKKMTEMNKYFNGAFKIPKSIIKRYYSSDVSNFDPLEINYLTMINPLDYFNPEHDFFKKKIVKFRKNNREIHGQCGPYHFRHDFRNANRNSIINHLIYKFGYKTYLEIGTNNCHHFSDVRCPEKTGVDPSPPLSDPVFQEHRSQIVISPSDKFFKTLPSIKKYDLIFIDGCLMEANLINDITNAIKHLSLPNGTIVIHDCNPPHEFLQRDPQHFLQHYNQQRKLVWNNRTYTDKHWNGQTWKVMVKLRETLGKRISMEVVDTDWGVGIIRFGKTDNAILVKIKEKGEDLYQYNTLVKYRRELLNLISIEEFLEKYL